MSTTCAVMQKSPDAPSVEQLKAAYRDVPGVTAVDAERVSQNVFGILARQLRADQAAALQAGLQAQGIDSEVIEETALPALPPAKAVRRLEFTPEAMMVYDPLNRPFPVAWDHLMLLAAGSVQQANFQRVRTEREEIRVKLVHGMPVPVRETKVGYSSQESAAKVLRGEIIFVRSAARFCIEAESFNYAGCLGDRCQRDVPVDFCLLMRELANRAPQAVRARGVASILAEPPAFIAYLRHKFLEEEIIWMMWRAMAA